MTGHITFAMIKPLAVSKNNTGPILAKINEAGFRLKALRMLEMNKEQAEAFYEIHRERDFFEALANFMSSGPVVAMVLEKENAVEDFRKLIGNTNPKDAKEGTIRKLFAESIQNNAIHGSDSDENALREASFFFPKIELS